MKRIKFKIKLGVDIAMIADLSTGALYRFIHDLSGILLIVLILVHLVINWNTLWCYLRNTLKNRNTQKVQESCENV